MAKNQLFYGDNLDVLRRDIKDESVDLIYLDPAVQLQQGGVSASWLHLHCDPTATHYLKVLLDAIFGVENFRNEVVWQRTASKGLASRRLPANHDVILPYQRSAGATWNEDAIFIPYDPPQESQPQEHFKHGALVNLDALKNSLGVGEE